MRGKGDPELQHEAEHQQRFEGSGPNGYSKEQIHEEVVWELQSQAPSCSIIRRESWYSTSGEPKSCLEGGRRRIVLCVIH